QARLEVDVGIPRGEGELPAGPVVLDAGRLHVPVPVERRAEDDTPARPRVEHSNRARVVHGRAAPPERGSVAGFAHVRYGRSTISRTSPRTSVGRGQRRS